MIYKDFISDEPLDIIRSNECDSQVGSLATARFRRLWNELEQAQQKLSLYEEMRKGLQLLYDEADEYVFFKKSGAVHSSRSIQLVADLLVRADAIEQKEKEQGED